MSDTKLYKEKGKSKRGKYGEDFDDYPFKVKKHIERHCGSKDDMIDFAYMKRGVAKNELRHIKEEYGL